MCRSLPLDRALRPRSARAGRVVRAGAAKRWAAASRAAWVRRAIRRRGCARPSSRTSAASRAPRRIEPAASHSCANTSWTTSSAATGSRNTPRAAAKRHRAVLSVGALEVAGSLRSPVRFFSISSRKRSTKCRDSARRKTRHLKSPARSRVPGSDGPHLARLQGTTSDRRGRGSAAPGQYLTTDFPVLSAGPTPHAPLDEWSFAIGGAVDEPRALDLGGVPALPTETITVDIHCVTKWSKLDTAWRGVSRRHAARRRRHRGRLRDRRSATAATPPTCRSRTSPAARPGSRSATTASRSSPSTAARPACSSPISTSGRAPSGCAASSCATHDEPGFWERNGYHNYGDPWHEQRYWGD